MRDDELDIVGDELKRLDGKPDPWLDDFDDYDIDYTREYPARQCTLSIGGVGCFPLGNIAVVCAKYKHGKSALSCLFTAALLGMERFGVKRLNEGNKVIVFDTEQELSDTVELGKKIFAMMGRPAGKNFPDIRVKHIRRVLPVQNWQYIMDWTRKLKPSAIVIDGVNDLVLDPNEPKVCTQQIAELNSFAEELNVAIFCVIHENKNDSNPQGVMGTQLLKKAADIVTVNKCGGVFTVSQTHARGHAEFPSWCFVLDGNGVPQETSAQPQTAKGSGGKSNNTEELRNYMPAAFGDDDSLGRNELQRRYVEVSKTFYQKKDGNVGMSDNTASRRIDEALVTGILCKDDNGKYRIAEQDE